MPPAKKKTSAPEKKSHAASQLGGQPESDRDAREAGIESATSARPSARPDKRPKA